MIRSILRTAGIESASRTRYESDVACLRRVVGQVHEQGDSIQTTVLLEVLLEEPSSLHVDTHGTENNREVVGVSVMYTLGSSRTVNGIAGSVHKTSLTTDLGGDLCKGGPVTSWPGYVGIV
jgi:hypothetical protein